MTAARASLLAAIALVSLACTRPLDVAAVPASGGGGSGGAPVGDGGGGKDAGGGFAPTSTCAAPPTFILVSAANELFLFDPKDESSKALGTLDCESVTTNKAGVISAALDAFGDIYYLLDTQEIVYAKTGTPNLCTPWGKPPAPAAQAIAFNGGGAERLYVAAEGKVLATDAPSVGAWTALGGIPDSDTVRALLGTGDGRLFAALSPSFETNLRIASLDIDKSSVGTTWLVPSPDGAPDAPSGFALYEDELLIFTEKSLVRFRFSTGKIVNEVIPAIDWPIVAVAAPACASTAP